MENLAGGTKMSIEAEILNSNQNVAVVGLSPKTDRPSYIVASYLKEHGYKVIPVNPGEKEILNETCYPDLSSVAEQLAIVEEAIRKGAKVIWMQEGIVNQEAADKAKEAGLLVVMDRCMRKEHRRLEG